MRTKFIEILAAVIMMTKYWMKAVQNKDDEGNASRLLQENYLKYQQMALIIWEMRSILKTKSDYL